MINEKNPAHRLKLILLVAISTALLAGCFGTETKSQLPISRQTGNGGGDDKRIETPVTKVIEEPKLDGRLHSGADGISTSLARMTSLAHEDLDATVWMRTSAEYHVLAIDTYRRALAAVNSGIEDPKWSAIPTQAITLAGASASAEPLLPAVILDIDETVLDNSQYQVECIQGEPFQFDGFQWKLWCERSEATPIAGVRDFVDGCRSRGVAIRYVTNRDSDVREVTLENLRKYGLVPDDESAELELLCKKDRPEWGSDKTNRREFVASQFRVLVLVGDDLNDFVFSGENATPAKRTEAAMESAERWGKFWFLLPNANYGGWEKSIQEYRFPAERNDYIRFKLESLKSVPAEAGSAQK